MPGGDLPLDRDGLSASAPHTVERLLELCRTWADEVGWDVTDDAGAADAVIVGPGVVRAEPGARDGGRAVVRIERAQGIDGFRWGIRGIAFARQWPVETMPYGLIADQVLDVRRPRRQRRIGVAVLVHGGFWMQSWRRDLLNGIAVDLAQHGWETWNVEYGRVGGSGGWPQTGQDVVAALDAVLRYAEADQVVAIGHSAGAQLALRAAAQRPDSVVQVVSLAGLCDLETARRQRLGGGAVDRLLAGADVQEATPLAALPLRVPVLAVHCVGDAVVPVEQSARYVAAATAAGDAAELLVLDEGDHMSLIEPEAAWPAVVPRLVV